MTSHRYDRHLSHDRRFPRDALRHETLPANSARRKIGRPMVGTFPVCCACAASGHAAAAPPSAASNSRLPMVTVIRPSRARRVIERYHATSVLSLTARHLARATRAPSRTVNVLAVFTPNETALHRWGFPLYRRLLRSSTVVCETLSTRAMARMLSPFSARARTWRSNFLPNALALAPKCSTASAFKNGANSRRGVR